MSLKKNNHSNYFVNFLLTACIISSFIQPSIRSSANYIDFSKFIFRYELWSILLVVFFSFRYLFSKKKTRSKIQKYAQQQALIILFFIFSVIFVSFSQYSINISPLNFNIYIELFQMFLNAFLYISISFFYNSLIYLRRALINIILIVPIFYLILGLYSLATGINNFESINPINDFDTGFIGSGNRLQGLSSNPNILATICSVAYCFSFYNFLLYKNFKKIIWFFYICLLIICILWTGVRASLFILLVTSVIIIGRIYKGTFKQFYKTVFYILLLITLFFTLFSLDRNGIFSTIFSRLESGDGRIDLWVYYFSKFIQNPFGYGINYEFILGASDIINGQRLPPHNFILYSLVMSGIFGFFISLKYLFNSFKVHNFNYEDKSNKFINDTIRLKIGLYVIIFHSFFGGFFMMDPLFTLICLVKFI